MAGEPGTGTEKRIDPRRGAWGLLVAAAIVPFLPALFNGWVWDDELVHANPDLESLAGLFRIWFYPFENQEAGSRYWPLLYTSFWIEHQLWGVRPMGYHATNLLLHAANTVLFWKVLGKLRVRGALAAALLFAVHPVHVESVAWVIERKTLLASLFTLASAVLWLDERPEGRRHRTVLATLLFAAACLSKPVALVLPGVLLALEWARDGRANVRRAAPMLVLATLFAALTATLSALFEATPGDYSLPDRLRIAGWTTLSYVRLSIVPLPLSPIHARPDWVLGAAGWLTVAAVLGLCVAAAVAWKRSRWIPAGLFAFLLLLGPTSGLVEFGFMKHSWIAERFLYLPVGVVLAAVCALASKFGRGLQAERMRLGALVLATAACVWGSWNYTQVYGDMKSLFTYALRHHPESYIAHYNLGHAALGDGDIQTAAERLQEAVRIDPEAAEAWTNLGVTARRAGRADVAEAALRRALEIEPNRATALANLGSVEADRGNLDEALRLLDAAILRDPSEWKAHSERGVVLSSLARPEDALAAFDEAARLAPDAAEPALNAAILLRSLGRNDAAQARLDAFLVRRPDSVPALQLRQQLNGG